MLRRAGRGVFAAAFFVAAAGAAIAPGREAPVPTLEISGIVVDARGPLANKVVRVGPVDANGRMLMIRGLSGARSGQGLNPQSTTDAQGRFKVVVSRNLLRGYAAGAIGIAAYTDLGGGRMSTSHRNAVVKIDPAGDRVDAGRVLLQPLTASR